MGRRQIFDHGDTVIYKKYSIYLSIQTTKIYLTYIFVHSSWLTAPKTLGISSVRRAMKGVFCYVSEVTFGKCIRMGAGCRGARRGIRGLEPVVPPFSLLGVGRGCVLNHLPVTNDFINYDCNEAIIKNPRDRIWNASRLVNMWK